MTGSLHHVDADRLGWWLSERQLPSGGLNGRRVHVLCFGISLNSTITGRPEKLPDVCYSWWVLASLKIINRLHWINKVLLLEGTSCMMLIPLDLSQEKLTEFILASQDEETGGFSDRPGDEVILLILKPRSIISL